MNDLVGFSVTIVDRKDFVALRKSEVYKRRWKLLGVSLERQSIG